MVTLRIMTISSITNRAGIATVENRSIPLETPPITMRTVNATKISE